MTDVSLFLKNRREDLKKSRKEVAEEAGLSKVYIEKIESGQKSISMKSVYFLAEAYEVEPKELIEMALEELLNKVLKRE